MVKLLSFSFFVVLCFGVSAAQFSLQEIMQLPQRILFKFLKLNSNIKSHQNISSDCKDSLSLMKKGISAPMNNTWAMQMIDAMGKLPAGIMQFSMSFVGSYDQCLSVDADGQFRGQFCTLGIGYNSRASSPSAGAGYMQGLDKISSGKYAGAASSFLKPQWDVCFPSTCTPEEVLITMNTVVDSLDVPLNFTMMGCDVEQETKLDDAQITSIAIFSLLGLLLFLGTSIDLAMIVLRKLQPNVNNSDITQVKAVKILMAFSLYNNAKKMLNTKTSSDNLGAINGIRFLSMTWIILGHTYTFLNIVLIGNIAGLATYFRNFEFQVVMNGTVSVDVFFFLSGLLLAYVSMKEVKKRGKMNWFLFYFHRFWRLTPAYALVILSIFLMPLLGSGPYWKLSWEKTVDDCKTNWWTSLLYVNNFVRMGNMCVIHGWYLANDMQFFVLSPLILYVWFRWPIGGLLVNLGFMMLTMVTPALLVLARDYAPTLVFLPEMGDPMAYMMNIYMKPYCRMSTYCIGIFIGFMLASKKRYEIHPIVQTIFWSLSIAASVAVVYGTYEWNNGHPSSLPVNALFVATNRPAFTMGIAWMTYACCTGYGGIVNRILSWKPFIPLGRMTFMAYLFHPYIMYFLNFSLRERIIVTHYYMVVTFLGFLVISYGVSFVASICFETPLLNLEKILLSKLTQPKQASADEEAKVNGEMVMTNGGKENPAFKSENEKY